MTTPATYRKNPAQVQAMRYDGSRESGDAIIAWSDRKAGWEYAFAPYPKTFAALVVDTLEGRLTVSPGDYVIRGVAGEFYPCKPGIFAATYTEVTPDSGGARCVTVELPDPVRGVTDGDARYRPDTPYSRWTAIFLGGAISASVWPSEDRYPGGVWLDLDCDNLVDPISVDQARYLGLALLAACVEAEK